MAGRAQRRRSRTEREPAARLLRRSRLAMTRKLAMASLLLASACYQRTNDRLVSAAFVNDACGANATEAACGGVCEWHAVASECPTGALCPVGVCVTRDPCAQLLDEASC